MNKAVALGYPRYLLNLAAIVSVAMLLMVTTPALAAKVADLYQVSVPVTSQNQKARDEALGRALSEIIVKVTGRKEALALPEIESALREAQKFVQSFSYDRDSSQSPSQLELKARFDPRAVNQLLRDNDQAIWDANRPDTLVWIAVEKNRKRTIEKDNPDSEWTNALKFTMSERSLPVTFPLLDFEDETTISTIDVWGLFADRIKQASSRYGSESILAGRLRQTGDRYNGRLILLFKNHKVDAEITDLSPEELSIAVANLVGTTLSEHYGVKSGLIDASPKLVVENVQSTKDYAGVVQYLSDLTAVRDVTVTRIKGSRIELELKIDGTVDQLKDFIGLGRKLQPSEELPSGLALNYFWQGN
ncbi:hypothetical protein EOPP23_20535 [Endozoicomonas sp. OPT23]|uniref:DUF2066 domain-containing protein n=1 Tax=Endozoicomonas sp. OPT23 TaxID=2072845 RepID=UPI00129A2974|nr:DUF2066 domain-containing protein [Endozoicomonas sp. OPT23]MRI35350.1 hypothetical protein [Endozoicomonas sp. OPT23]